MRSIAQIWGIGGVVLMLGFAVVRLAPMALALRGYPLNALHWGALVFVVVYMAYAEGYKGFHLAFAPRVVARASYLANHPSRIHLLFAPLFCMCYFHTTRKRQLVSIGLTAMIVCFVVIARQLPSPWRGIVDAGVVVGLCIGIGSIFYYVIKVRSQSGDFFALAEVPVKA
ncbi:MAG: hypothetical protein AB8B95_04900 [Pseudohongiellaceae bacterium]